MKIKYYNLVSALIINLLLITSIKASEKSLFVASSSKVGNELFLYENNTFSLIEDINQKTQRIGLNSFKIEFNGKYYLGYKNDLEEDYDIWVFDGVNDPVRLKDQFENLPTFKSPSFGKVYNNKLYFVAETDSYGRELWVYDGTNAPTLVQDFNAGEEDSYINYFSILNDVLYFSVSYGGDTKLWKIDSANDPEIALEEFSSWTTPEAINGKLYYIRRTPDYTDYAIYSYDGEDNIKVKDLNIDTNPSDSLALNDKYYMYLRDDGNSYLKEYDPSSGVLKTLHSEYAIQDFNGFTISTSFGNFISNGTKIFYTTSTQEDMTSNMEFYVYDQNNTSKTRIKYYNGSISLAEYNDKVYISAAEGYYNNYTYKLYEYDVQSDPSTVDPSLVQDYSSDSNLTSVGGVVFGLDNKLYFTATTDQYDSELWKYDLSINTYEITKDMNTNTKDSNPEIITKISDTEVLVKANDGTNDILYSYSISDNTLTPKNFSTSFTSDYSEVAVLNNKLYFSANDGTNGEELWVYDGVNEPSMVYNIRSGSSSSSPENFVVFDNKLYFSANDGTNGKELWVYDGVNNPSMVYDIYPGETYYSSSPENFVIFDNKLYFSANDGTNGKELWVYDGVNNPSMVYDIYPGETYYSSSPENFVVFDNKLYFSANDGTNGTELWVYDGVNDPSMVYNIRSSSSSSSPENFVVFDNKLYFSANDGTNGTELWVYDGENNPSMVIDLNTQYSFSSSSPENFIVLNGKLYFTANDESGEKFWVYDGVNDPIEVSDIKYNNDTLKLNEKYLLWNVSSPTSSDINITIDEDTNKTFSVSDFNFTGVDTNDSLNSIFITTLESDGNLTLNGSEVTLNQEISSSDISNLVFSPSANEYGTSYATFGFKVNDGDLSSSEYTATINVTAVDDAPSITSTAQTNATEDSAYSYTLTGSDVEGSDLNWSVTDSTTLPSWLELNSTSSWENVGSAGFSAAQANYTSIAFDSNDTPYVVYRDDGDSFKTTVMKYDGSSWVVVGSAGFSAGQAAFTSIAFDSSDTPYVVYRDSGNSNKATVMKYDGNSWVAVGSAGFSAGGASYTSIAFDSNDTPYVVYKDSGNSDKATVMKYDGSSWVAVGSAGFSAGLVYYTSIAFDSSDTPYVVYKDYGNSYKATVMKYDGNSWVVVGSAGFSTSTADFTSIAFDSSDTPYVVYQDGENYKATVMKYDGSSWVAVGSAGFSAGETQYTSIAFDSSDTPYVVYEDYGNNGKATVMKYDGNSWVVVGSAGFSASTAFDTSIAFDSNDTPYVVYKDSGNSDKATVMKLNSSTTLSGTPTNDDVGIHDVNITVSDGTTTADQVFTITVANTNDEPITTLPSAPTINEDATNVAFADTIQIADDDNDNQTVTLTVTNGTLSLTTTDLSFTNGDGTDDSTMSFSGTLAAVNTALDSLTFSPTANYDGSASLRVQTDDGNSASDDDTLNLTVLNAPEVTSINRKTPSAQTTNANTLIYTVTFSESVSGITTNDFSVNGSSATVQSVSASSGTSVDITISGGDLTSYNGTVGLKFVDDNSVKNSNGVPIGGDGIDHFTTGQTYTLDNSAPTPNLTSATDNVGSVTGALSSGDTTDDTSLVLAGTNESGSSVKVYNGTTLLGTATVSGTTWSYTATIADGTTYQFNVKETDSAGNESTATSNFTVIGDTTAPSITIASDKDSLKKNETATITFTLSESSTDFVSSDVTVSGGTLSNFSGSGTTYTATFTPSADSTTGGTIDVAAAKFTDAAGNDNSKATQKTISIDTVVPSITIASDKTALKAGETATITFSLSESSTDFVSSDVVVAGGTLSNFSGSGTTYTATFTPTANTTTAGTIDVAAAKFTDVAGNDNSKATQKSISIDTVVPSVVITSNKDTLKKNETATITFSLSESSTDFVSLDVTVAGGTLSNFSGSGTTYTATFTPSANTTTGGTIDVAAAKFTDAAGNDNSKATQKTISIDTVVPSITIASDKDEVINGEETTLSFTLSEESSDFTENDITIVGGSISEFAQDNTNSKLYTAKLTVDNITTTQVTIDVNEKVFMDAAGNDNAQATQKVITILPSIIKFTPSLDSTDIALDSALKLEFSEEVIKGTTGNISIYRASDDALIEVIDVSSSKVSIEVPNSTNGLTNTTITILKDTKLDLLTQYYILIDNTTFKDVDNNFYSGINDKTAWKFTTIDNQAPVIISNNGQDSVVFSVNENQTSVIDIDATDVDVGQTLTYSLEGRDAASFNIDSSSGVITFKSAPNYEVKNSYSVDVKVADDSLVSLSDTQSLTININDVNDDPIINIDSTLTTNEDNSKDLVFTYSDEDSNTVVASQKVAPTNGNIAITGTTITYTPNADYNGSDTFILTLSDGNGYTIDKTIAVNITPVDDAPVLTTTLDNVSENEDGKGLVISLSTFDIDNDLTISLPTYKVTSSDENIAIAYILNGKLIVVPKENATGTVTITVFTTVNGLTTSKSFTYTLNEVNDNPLITNIADISLDQSSSDISKVVVFNIWDDKDVESLSISSSNTNFIANENLSVEKLSSSEASLTYKIDANNVGTSIISVLAKDNEGLTFTESFTITVKASNDALCVENTNTALTFDTIKGNNEYQSSITSNLDFVSSIDSVCSSIITWSVSDDSVIDSNGIVTQANENKTVKATATITKGEFTASNEFLLTVPTSTLSDEDARDQLLFEYIRAENLVKSKIVSKLNLIDSFLGKSVTWSVDDDSALSPYSGYVTRLSSDTNVNLTASIGSESKTFALTILKEEVNNEDKALRDSELLNYFSILGDNKSKDEVIYNLAKPLPITGVNGSTITWSSSNTDVITNEGDVLRDENSDKTVVLTATITNGDVTHTKEFTLNVLQNKIATTNNTTFVNAEKTTNKTEVNISDNGTAKTTSLNFANTISNIVEQVISENSVKSIIEFAENVVNVFLNTDGTSQTSSSNEDGTSSSIKTENTGSSTSMDDNGNVQMTDGSVTLKLNSDGSVEHQVTNGKTTIANSTIPGSNTNSDKDGNVKTTAQIKQSGFVYKAVVETDSSGETKTKFVQVDLSTGDETDVDKTTDDATPFPVGSEVNISMIGGVLYLSTSVPLDGNIVIE